MATIQSILTFQDKMSAIIDKVSKSLENATKSSNATKNAIEKLQNSANNSGNGFSNMQAKIITLSSAFQLLGQAKGVIDTLNAKINEFIGYTKIQMQVEDQLSIITKQRMGLNDEEVRSLYELASAQQKVGVLGDEVALAGMSGLAAFTKQKQSIEALTPAMNNLAVKMYGYNATAQSMDMISKSLGKAMLGDVGALSRMGIKIDDNQKKWLMTLNEEQRAVELSKIITAVTGDMNEEMAKTPFGKIAQANNKLSDSYERLGAALLPLQSTLTEVWSNIVEKIVNNLTYIVPVATVALGSIAAGFIAIKWQAITAWAAAIAPVTAVIAAITGVSLIMKACGVSFQTQGKAIMNVFFMIANVVQDVGIIIANTFRSIYNGVVNVTNLVRKIQGKPLLEKKEYTKLKGWKDATESTEKISKSLKGGALTNRALLGKSSSGINLDSVITSTSGGKALKTQNQGEIEINGEDLQLLHDMATRDYMIKYSQQNLTPQVTLPNVVIHETADVDSVVESLVNAVTDLAQSKLVVT